MSMYDNFGNGSLCGVPHYIKVAENICEEIPNKFRRTVRQTSVGEKVFRTRLYEMMKKLHRPSQYGCLKIYTCSEGVGVSG
jgi:hypothetical protein